MKRNLFVLTITLLLVFTAAAQSNEEILELLRDRVEVAKINQSISVAVIDEKGTRFINLGKISNEAGAPDADENTLYEIGSITKTFVGTLLAEAIRLGEVKADDPISKYLPKKIKTPQHNGKEITLLDLVTHTSGLPRVPTNSIKYPAMEVNGLYTEADAFEFLSTYQLPREIGAKYEYSNFGMGLLGYILSRRAKIPFEELVKKRILKPLGMNETIITVSPGSKLALGFDTNGDPAKSRPNGSKIFLGSGSIRSTASDMAKYAAANLGLSESKLMPSFEAAQQTVRDIAPGTTIGYAWHSFETPHKSKVTGHGGATISYMSELQMDRANKRAVVVLTNSFEEVGTIARYILDQRFPKPVAPVNVAVDAKILDEYVGEYELAPNVLFTITRSDSRFFAQLSGQPRFRVFAKSQNEFYFRVVKASIIFNKDESGKVVSLTLDQKGKQTAKKIK